MPKERKAVHVARIRSEYKGRKYESVLLRRSYREDGKVKHETLGNLSHLPPHVIELLEGALKGDAFVRVEDTFEIQRSWAHGHVVLVLEALRQCRLAELIRVKANRRLNLIQAMIVHRLLEPGSKLACAQSLSDETASNSLGRLLNLGEVNEDELYEAMDWLLTKQEAIEQKLAKRHLKDGSIVLYDVTSTYFEGRKCPLARRGYSRDHRRDRLQVVIGLLCDSQGCPVAVQVFEGNTGDPSTVPAQIVKLRERFGLSKVVMVGDRGMLTDARIREDVEPADLEWISSLRAPAIAELVKDGNIQLSLFEEVDLAEIRHDRYPGERLVVCRNPLLAEQRRRKRLELLAATEKHLADVQAATARVKRPLRGKDKIGLRIGRVLNKFKMAKHFVCHIEEDSFTFGRDEDGIAQEAALDGIYVVRTSLDESAMNAETVVETYKSLSTVERAFRSMKTVDLKIRPIYHRLPDRVRAHAFICMLAYYVEWHLRRQLAPILFDDTEKEETRQKRASVVAPAQRSDDALEKARSKRTRNNEPVQGLQRLLKTMATLTRSEVKFGNATFTKISVPTEIQRRALTLAGINSL